jgi:hypothetical protein
VKQCSSAPTDRTIADANVVEVCINLEPYTSAMTRPLIGFLQLMSSISRVSYAGSSLLIRMHPLVTGDLLSFGQLYHIHGRRISPFLQDRHFSAASSFQIGVSRGRHIASRGMLARVLQRWHSTSSQPYPPLRHCAMLGDGCALRWMLSRVSRASATYHPTH